MTGFRALSRALAVAGLAAFLAVGTPARADAYLDDWHPYQTYWGVAWNVAVPVTSLRTYISSPGWLGGGFDVRVGVWGRLAVGVSGTWNFFERTASSLTVEQPNFTFTGPVYRRLSTFALLGTVHYYLTQTTVQPFVGVGVGGAWLTTSQRIVNLTTGQYNTGVAVVPEAGLLFNLGPRIGLYVSGRYQISLTTLAGVENPQWASGVLGFAYYY